MKLISHLNVPTANSECIDKIASQIITIPHKNPIKHGHPNGQPGPSLDAARSGTRMSLIGVGMP